MTQTVDPSSTTTVTVTNPQLLTTQESALKETIANFSFIDVAYAAGAFVATLENSFPNQSFEGKGTFSFSEVVATSGGGSSSGNEYRQNRRWTVSGYLIRQ